MMNLVSVMAAATVKATVGALSPVARYGAIDSLIGRRVDVMRVPS